ncbi:uncharacterized protein C8Q71DRAFT_404946 [Rhodofomes roseus]|uniref:PEHE domain-containing protein n=1 Tax=Rhodofomes roseus TaxID=34475 RepID=A0ABQ8K033_9APHY|nr:uncharacterized protein C8Q71DRAFT_404946 [Rhodofomes roseus]KAH9829452.1 hypothetical protein C8Q71DRAFT_404946 [Rhodofomes roseus]
MATTEQTAPRDSNADEHASQAPVSVNGTPKKGGAPPPKRVLPSRSRRGGPGVGSCETDMMILDTMRRRLENEPLIPATTKFLLTTNSSLVPSTSDAPNFEVEINTHAYGRYFDRPEVQKAYKEQQLIQTPEFTQLDEDASVGGRFRPRVAEDEPADTSDAAYEKRHRKYETFEKRQRLREKEKLKHEQYKLKERIDQLRGMDPSAFLTLPASDFPPPPDVPPDDVVEQNGDGIELGGLHPHGAAQVEGERRRKEMLAIASSLEDRYRTLLNPDKKPPEKKYGSHAVSEVVASDSEPEPEENDEMQEEAAEVEEEEEEEVDELDQSEEADTMLPQRPSYHDESGESEVDFDERDRQRSKGLKLKIKFPPRTPAQLKDALSKSTTKKKKQTTLSPFMKHALEASRKVDDQSPTKMLATTSILTTTAFAPPRARGASGKFLPKGKEHDSASPTKVHPRKRPRTDSLASFTHPTKPTNGESISSGAVRPMRLDSPGSRQYATYAGAAGKQEQTTCVLMAAALRNSAAPNVRKTQRNVLAFGARVPPEIELVRDFEVPEWVLNQDTEDDAQDELSLDGGPPDEYRSLSRDFKRESVASERNGLLSRANEEDTVQIAYLEQ